MSEFVGFTAEYNENDPFDYIAGITAYEVARQWWPGQMTSAEMEGYSVFIETLAQYSAHMVIKQTRGEEQVRRYVDLTVTEHHVHTHLFAMAMHA